MANVQNQGQGVNVIPPQIRENLAYHQLGDVSKLFRILIQMYGWSDHKTVNHALKGSDKIWFEGLESIVYTWQEWTALIKKMVFLRKRPRNCTAKYSNELKNPSKLSNDIMTKNCESEEAMIKYLITGLNDQ